ncbi:copper transporter, partial [Lactobacillus johnsonii]|uniref:copper transporter n=1 Tax=Lactobacillus johnsonii TaxID=33959 RepID=UPI00201ADA53
GGVVAEEFREVEGGPDQGDIVATVREDPQRAAALSTVDDLGQQSGRLAAVLAEAGVSTGVVGHYGSGLGTQGPLPEWPESP